MTNAEFREVLEERTAKYAVEVFKYLRELPYDVSTKVVAHQLGKSASSIGANYHAESTAKHPEKRPLPQTPPLLTSQCVGGGEK